MSDNAYDVIILSDFANDAWDVQRVLEQIRPLCTSRTRIILNVYSNLWQTVLTLAQRLHLAARLWQNFLFPSGTRDLPDFLQQTGAPGA